MLMKYRLSWKKWIVLGLIAGASLWAVHFFRHRHPNAVLSTQTETVVDVESVHQGSIPIEAHAIGTLVAAQHVEIIPEVAGQVANILFADGAAVKRGATLFQLDDAVYHAKLESAKANRIYSEADYRRKISLGKQGAISEQAIEQALADLKEKMAAEKESQVMLSKMRLIAPFDGVMGKAAISLGDHVTSGQALVSLTDIQHLRVEYVVSERYLPELKSGQQIIITSNTYPGQQFAGTVKFISPTINTENRTISLYAEVPNDRRLLTAGLFVNVTHRLGVKNNVLIIPSASLVPMIDGQHVFKIINNKAVSVLVKTGQWVQNNVQVLSGLSLEDRIVTAGQQKLKEGMLVKVNMTEEKTHA